MNPLNTYYIDLCSDYRLYLKEIFLKASSDNIHNLRIIIKRIRALLHLLASADSDFDFEKHFKPFRTIFKAAGKLRDLDITIKKVQKLDVDHRKTEVKNILAVLHSKRNTQAADVKSIVKGILADGNKYDETAERILKNNMRMDVVENFLKQTLSDVKHETRKHISNDRLHGIRKLYKDYIYDSQGTGLDAQQNIRKKYRNIDEMQKQIGNWHDYVIACDILTDLAKEEKGVDKILKELKKGKKGLKKTIVDKL